MRGASPPSRTLALSWSAPAVGGRRGWVGGWVGRWRVQVRGVCVWRGGEPMVGGWVGEALTHLHPPITHPPTHTLPHPPTTHPPTHPSQRRGGAGGRGDAAAARGVVGLDPHRRERAAAGRRRALQGAPPQAACSCAACCLCVCVCAAAGRRRALQGAPPLRAACLLACLCRVWGCLLVQGVGVLACAGCGGACLCRVWGLFRVRVKAAFAPLTSHLTPPTPRTHLPTHPPTPPTHLPAHAPALPMLHQQVVEVQTEPRPKVLVSLKRMEGDPLQQTLDLVLPLSGVSEGWVGGWVCGGGCMCVCGGGMWGALPLIRPTHTLTHSALIAHCLHAGWRVRGSGDCARLCALWA